MTISATDDFNRANNPTGLGANWSIIFSLDAFKILSNVAQVLGVSANCGMWYNAASLPTSQYSQAKLTAPGFGTIGPAINIATATLDCYFLSVGHIGAASDVTVYKLTTGGGYVILQTIGLDWSDGDTFALGKVGNILFVTHNGALIGSPMTDSTITSGFSGIFSLTNVPWIPTLDDWECGVPDAAYGNLNWLDFPKYVLRREGR